MNITCPFRPLHPHDYIFCLCMSLELIFWVRYGDREYTYCFDSYARPLDDCRGDGGYDRYDRYDRYYDRYDRYDQRYNTRYDACLRLKKSSREVAGFFVRHCVALNKPTYKDLYT